MNEIPALPLPELAQTLEASPAPVPLYWEYVASAYVVVAAAMLWLVATSYRERIRLRKRQGMR